jgi:hypothetical protein
VPALSIVAQTLHIEEYAMKETAEVAERTGFIALGDDLASAHDEIVLGEALKVRLVLDGRKGLATLIMAAERERDSPFTDSGRFSAALVGRLRVEARGELADAIVALLSGGPIDCDPLLWLNEVHAKIARRRAAAAHLRAHAHSAHADLIESTLSVDLRVALLERLRADGLGELAEAISSSAYELDAPQHRPGPPPSERHATADSKTPPPELATHTTPGRALGHDHPADLLAFALVRRLRAVGREVFAGVIMTLWARDVAGPIVDPEWLATLLLEQLRKEGRRALADTIASHLRGTSIARDPSEMMALWLQELAGPIVDAGPLAAALVSALRKERHGELAERVKTTIER